MNILLILLAAAQLAPGGAGGPADPDAAPSVEEEIVVIGNRLESWRGQATFMNKRPRCKTIASTGDARIDRIGCDAMIHCIVATRDAFAIRDKAQPKTSAADTEQWRRAMGECVRDRRRSGLRAYVAARRSR